ncbi:dentin sialophosphoprotein-like [Bradysia coprophila]|uniref:dentin sialophosphoprotein-like n=1 Tax=Bradysia coprophila TaxID=38358 RepID=UPI00187DCFDB|nr:dentin sialophosphoprotein-like [Bradysia coprophila]
MSSDQQLNVHISGGNDLCHSEQNNDSQYHEKCSVDNVINASVLENKAVMSRNDTNGGSGQNLEANPNHEHSAIAENVNVPSYLEEIVSESGVVQSHDKLPLTDNGKVVTDEPDNVLCNLKNGYENAPSSLIDEVIPIPANEEKVLTADSQVRSEGTLQTNNLDRPTDPQAENPSDKNLSLCTKKEDGHSCVQQENTESIDDLPVTECHTNDRPVGFTNTHNAGDEEFEENDVDNDDASNDDDDNFSNEHDSNEECSDVEHSDRTTEVENDEYILDTVLRKPRKERRRIVSVNDDSDPEVDMERERLLESPTMDENQLSDIEVEEDIVHLIQNEKPGPKSKKFSTQKLKELQARELLRNAVVIPSSSKKKKCRVIDSEDEEEPLPYSVDVDDIGLPDAVEDNENENDALAGCSILLNDLNDFDKPDISIENLMQNCSPDVNHVNEDTIKSEAKDDNTPVESQCIPDIKCESSREVKNQSTEVVTTLKEEVVDGTENETGALCDSGNSTDSTNQQNKGEIESNSAKIDFPPFSSSTSSDTEDEFIPNEVYFGTPDHKKKRSSRGKSQRARGRAAQSSTREVKTVQNLSRPSNRGRIDGRPSRRENFIDNRRISSTSGSVSGMSSDSEDEHRGSKARRKPATITIVKQSSQLYHKASLPVRPIPRQHQIQQIKRQNERKRDRFYDKSQDIPNSVYFGDVDVPLHVLHSYKTLKIKNPKPNITTKNKFLNFPKWPTSLFINVPHFSLKSFFCDIESSLNLENVEIYEYVHVKYFYEPQIPDSRNFQGAPRTSRERKS